jgi:hypothetical protein
MEHARRRLIPGAGVRGPAGRRTAVVPFAVLGLAILLAAAGTRPALAQASTPLPTDERREDRRKSEDPNRWPPGQRGKAVVMWEHLEDSNDMDYEDFSAFVSWKQVHAQVWSGEYTDGFQVGGYLRDRRKSTYAAFYRYRDDFDHVVQFDTEQVLKKGFVIAGMLRFIRIVDFGTKQQEAILSGEDIGDEEQIQVGAGFDWYWGDYNFLSFRAVNDPRDSGRWSFITSHRFQNEPAFYIQPGVILRTDGEQGWFLRGKIKMFVWSVGDFDRFDWTDVDRTTYMAGVEIPF